MDMLGTVDPVNVHHVMSSNFPNFPKEPKFLKMFDVLGDGIFNSNVDLWKNQKKLARVLINHQRFYRFLVKTSRGKVETGLIPVLNHVSKQGLIVDLQDLFQRFTFDTTCILITSYDPGCLSIEFPDVPFAKAMDDAEKALLTRHVVLETVWRIQSWLGIGHEKKLSKAWKTLDRHPTVEEKIIEELKSVIPEGETEKSWLLEEKELSRLVYLHAALCKSLRLYPPVPIQHKEPTQVDALPTGHHVHPKMKILFSLYAMRRMEFVWGEDC
ncbi:hypothetical protein ACSBR2_009191 [Camellia fascicularis]